MYSLTGDKRDKQSRRHKRRRQTITVEAGFKWGRKTIGFKSRRKTLRFKLGKKRVVKGYDRKWEDA
jgi:hypothetical protein